MMSRSTSATVTLSMIWSRPRTTMALTTLPPAPTVSADAGVEQPRRDIVGLLRFGLARRGAGQDHAIADALDRDVGVRAAPA